MHRKHYILLSIFMLLFSIYFISYVAAEESFNVFITLYPSYYSRSEEFEIYASPDHTPTEYCVYKLTAPSGYVYSESDDCGAWIASVNLLVANNPDDWGNVVGEWNVEVTAYKEGYSPAVGTKSFTIVDEHTCTDSDGGKNYDVRGVASDAVTINPDTCWYNDQVLEYYCTSRNTVDHLLYQCANGCENGACVSDGPAIDECTDSDGGVYYNVKGTVTAPRGKATDTCLNDNKLLEWVCDGDGIKDRYYDCQNGCEDGACIQSTPTGCKDSDDGKNFYVKGTFSGIWGDEFITKSDYCVDSFNSHDDVYSSNMYLREGFCENSELRIYLHNCPNGCEDGVCLAVPTEEKPVVEEEAEEKVICSDSDSGKNYYVEGKVKLYSEGVTDYNSDRCVDSSTLSEKYCPTDGLVGAIIYTCPNGCKDGACLPFYGREEAIEVVEEGLEDIESSADCPQKTCKTISDECVGENKLVIEECKIYIKSYDYCEEIINTNSKILRDVCEQEEDEIPKVLVCQGCQLDESTCIPFGTRLERQSIAYYCDISKMMTEQLENGLSCQNGYECVSNNCKGSICSPICSGCFDKNNNCLPFGTRIENDFCSIEGGLLTQKIEEQSCNNNYECSTNLCIDSNCVSSGMWQKFIRWITALFG